MVRKLILICLAGLLAACSAPSGDPVDDSRHQGREGGAVTPTTAALPSAAWQAPEDYAFTLDSSCGERMVIGRFRVVVADGEVVEVEGLDESGQATVEHRVRDEIPTLSDLLQEASSAKEQGADAVELRRTNRGRPTHLEIDWDSNAIDDEACYEVTEYSTR